MLSFQCEGCCGNACCFVILSPCDVCTLCFQRSKIRLKYGIEGSNVGDFCYSCFCPLCVLVQNHVEVKYADKSTTNEANGVALVVQQPIVVDANGNPIPQ